MFSEMWAAMSCVSLRTTVFVAVLMARYDGEDWFAVNISSPGKRETQHGAIYCLYFITKVIIMAQRFVFYLFSDGERHQIRMYSRKLIWYVLKLFLNNSL